MTPRPSSREAVVEYLTEYAEDLEARIQFETSVLAVRRDGDIWHVKTNKGDFCCAHLIVATGRERVKDMPVWAGTAANISIEGGKTMTLIDQPRPELPSRWRRPWQPDEATK